MARLPRKRSEADIYHVFLRGEGRRIIFEEDDDRRCFLRMLSSALDKYGAQCYAWCLMSNHVHLLLKVPFQKLPRLVQSLSGGYAGYFNSQHDHVGHVFAGRYGSAAVNDEAYLMTVVRYIHANPVKDGVSATLEYPWSSYNDYVHATGFVERDFVLGVFGGLQAFVGFHQGASVDGLDEAERSVSRIERSRLDDEQALKLADAVLDRHGLGRAMNLAALEKPLRDQGIALLRRAGLSVRQIERFTGLGRGAIAKVNWK